MAALRIIALAITATVLVEARWHQKRETTANICDPVNNTTRIQCYCTSDNYDRHVIRSANCHFVKKNVQPEDDDWKSFHALENATKITFSNTMGIAINYVPTKAINFMTSVTKLEIKYGNIDKILPFAFANLSFVEEIILSSNQIKSLAVNAFSHHKDLLSIGLDNNELVEINRDVFVDLPFLDKLFLTNNKITTVHDRAFMHLTSLKELEIDRNMIFSLNSEIFSGLTNLERIDLTGNNLEVIGDNTFSPLVNLKILSLDGNKIQMLDEKAFHGLSKLTALSLSHNNLTSIDNANIFSGLKDLNYLTFKSNKLVELKADVMAPILPNFFGNASSLDVEDNNFPCDCRLEWAVTIMNNTKNSRLKLAMENLKCNPDANLKEMWAKVEEAEKNDVKVFEEEDTQAQNGEYEYYDDVQLNGKLFYVDVRDLINCTKSKAPFHIKSDVTITTATTKASTSPVTSKPDPTVQISTTKLVNELQSTTTKIPEIVFKTSATEKVPKKYSTTTRVVTVSPKPVPDYDHGMASDEARTEKATKAHRSIQENIKEPSKHTSDACRNLSGVTILFTSIICLRIYF